MADAAPPAGVPVMMEPKLWTFELPNWCPPDRAMCEAIGPPAATFAASELLRLLKKLKVEIPPVKYRRQATVTVTYPAGAEARTPADLARPLADVLLAAGLVRGSGRDYCRLTVEVVRGGKLGTRFELSDDPMDCQLRGHRRQADGVVNAAEGEPVERPAAEVR